MLSQSMDNLEGASGLSCAAAAAVEYAAVTEHEESRQRVVMCRIRCGAVLVLVHLPFICLCSCYCVLPSLDQVFTNSRPLCPLGSCYMSLQHVALR